MTQIDYNRPLVKRTLDSGVEVFMFKDQPGVFLNSHGSPISLDLARKVGFDVDRLTKLRVRAERLDKAKQEIDRELATGAEKKVVAERDGYKLMSMGLGRHNILDPDDALMNTAPLPEAEALILFDQLAPKAVEAEMPPEPPAEPLEAKMPSELPTPQTEVKTLSPTAAAPSDSETAALDMENEGGPARSAGDKLPEDATLDDGGVVLAPKAPKRVWPNLAKADESLPEINESGGDQ